MQPYFINLRKIGVPDILPTFRIKSDGKKTNNLLLAKDSPIYNNGKQDGKIKNTFNNLPKLPKKSGKTISHSVITCEISPKNASELIHKALLFKGFSVTSLLYNRFIVDGKITIKSNVTIFYQYKGNLHNVHIGDITIKKVYKYYVTLPDGKKIERYSYFICGNCIKQLAKNIKNSYLFPNLQIEF
jgi:hypothetical protein